MNGPDRIGDVELSAYIDGELDALQQAEITDALTKDTSLVTRLAAFRADKERLAALYRPVKSAQIPASWANRINAAAVPRRLAHRPRAMWAMALAASVLILLGGIAGRYLFTPKPDTILQLALSARDRAAIDGGLTGAALANAAARDALLTRAVGLKMRTPDLLRLGWRLTEMDAGSGAVTLRYTGDAGRKLTLFVRQSAGAPRFDLLKTNGLRICVWQDEVVGAVMMGDMSAGQMMRVASAAYVDLNL